MSAAEGQARPVGLAALSAESWPAGLRDARALSERLATVERDLTLAHVQLGEAQLENDAHRARIAQLQSNLDFWRTVARGERAFKARLRFECDRLAYSLVRAGAEGAVGSAPFYRSLPVPQSIFTRRRPYLVGDCVCEKGVRPIVWFVATAHLRPGGRRPSKSRNWRVLEAGEKMEVAATPVYGHGAGGGHPVTNGWALRQSDVWVDSAWGAWGLEELSRAHLLNVIEFLCRHCCWWYERELGEGRALLPCPVHCYADAASWLLDTPLFNALLAERARRKVRRGRRLSEQRS